MFASCSASPVSSFTWDSVNQRFSEECGNLLHLIDLVLSLPATSSDAERGFSQMKLVKTDWRSKLTDDHLTDLMTVQLEGEDLGVFDPKKAIALWYSEGSRSRRPEFSQSSQSEIKSDDSEWDDDLDDLVRIDKELSILNKMQEIDNEEL